MANSPPTLADALQRLVAVVTATGVKIMLQAFVAGLSGFVIATLLGGLAAWSVIVYRAVLGLFGG